MNLSVFNFLVSALHDEVEALADTYRNVEPIVADVSKSKDKPNKLVAEHDLVIRYVPRFSDFHFNRKVVKVE